MKFKRLIDFDYQLMVRLNEIGNGYTPNCVECLDLDYTLDIDTAQPTLCLPCAVKNIHSLQATIKEMLDNGEI